jgi:hypothetical protein
MRKPEPMGMVELGWSMKLMLPLSKAHQLQTLLLEAKQYEVEYFGNHRARVITALEVPSVAVPTSNVTEIDLSEYPKADVTEYIAVVREGFRSNPDAQLADILPFAEWRKVKGE